jgi:hypothetical protein
LKKTLITTIFVANLISNVSAFAEIFPNASALLDRFQNQLSAAQILILGEVHDDLKEKAHYPELFAQVHQRFPDYDCLALEAGPDAQSIFTDFGEGKKNLTESAFAIAVLTDGKYADDYDTRQNVTMLSAWFDAVAQFNHWQNSLLFVDMTVADRLRTGADPLSDEACEVRNHFMANQLISAAQNQVCKKIISINGNWHLHLNRLNGSLPKYLFPYSVLALDMTDGSEAFTPQDPVFAARIDK